MKLNLKQYLFLFSVLCIGLHSNAQFSKATSRWKALFAVGFNYPTTDGFVDGAYAQSHARSISEWSADRKSPCTAQTASGKRRC